MYVYEKEISKTDCGVDILTTGQCTYYKMQLKIAYYPLVSLRPRYMVYNNNFKSVLRDLFFRLIKLQINEGIYL